MTHLKPIDRVAVRKRVYKRAVGHLTNRKLPLGFEAIKPDLFQAIDKLVLHFEALDVRALLPEGPVKAGINELYLAKLASVVLQEIAADNNAALKEHEDAEHAKLQAAISPDGKELVIDA